MQKYIIPQSTATFLYTEAYYLIIFHRKDALVFSGRTPLHQAANYMVSY